MTNLKLGLSRVGQVCIYPQPLTQPVRMQREQPLIEQVIDQSGGWVWQSNLSNSQVVIMESDGNLSMIGIEHG